MKSVVLDTNAAVEDLERGDFTRKQATALVNALRPLATKEDIKHLIMEMQERDERMEERLKADMQSRDERMHAEMQRMHADMQGLEKRLKVEMQSREERLKADNKLQTAQMGKAISESQKNTVVIMLTALLMSQGMFLALVKFLF